jgi:pimeloyl-ACP methyl ester carboxylesterase/DNA-binding CsgD family transcriptional regulator
MNAPPVQYVRTSDGYDIAFAVCGEGTPLLRVPQAFSHFDLQWRRGILTDYFQALAQRFKLILFDSRGQGSSTRGLPESTTLADYERDIEAVVERLRLKRFVLLGNSVKGKVAVNYAVAHPDQVVALILNHYRDPSREQPGLMAMAESNWPLYLQTAARLGWTHYDPDTVVAVNRQAATQADYVRQYVLLASEPSAEMLARVRTPTLLIGIREGIVPMLPEADIRIAAASIPNARAVFFDDPYGGWSGDRPPAVLAIQQFLEDTLASLPDPQDAGQIGARQAVKLTPREREVLHLIAAGRSNQQIADDLVLSLRTVERHITNLYGKIGAHGKADATAYALRHGFD